MTLDIILNELDELGARIDTLSGLGAAIAAALDDEVLRHGDVQNMLATSVGALLALQRKIRRAIDAEVQAVEAPAPPPTAAWMPQPRQEGVAPCSAISPRRAATA